MGYDTEGERLAKKIYALAYHRATAVVIEKHREEFEKELEFQKTSIRLEHQMFGEIETTRNKRKHVLGDDGKCEYDGQDWPCRQEKARLRQIRHRETESARSSTTGSSGEETSPSEAAS